jgi:hypothetical protein
MAQTPQRPSPQRQSPQEPPRHPAQPPAARPGVPQRDQQPRPDEPDQPPPEEKVLEKEEAMQLFRAGHRLKKAGDPPEKWFSASRIHGVLVLCYPVDEEIEKGIAEQDLVLAEEAPGQTGGQPIYSAPL